MASFNIGAANEAVVKHAHYISEISQNSECFNIEGGAELARPSLEYFLNILDTFFLKSEMCIATYVQCTL